MGKPGRRKPPGSVSIANQVITNKNILEVERLLLKGIQNYNEIARALRISESTAKKYMTEVSRRWRSESRQLTNEDARIRRIFQIENIATLALEAFERSTQSSHVRRVTSKNCHECNGTGRSEETINVPSQVRERILDRDNRQCVLCGADDDLTIDHIIPRSRGGSHADSNLRVLCFSCNRIKSNKLGFGHQCEDCSGTGKNEIRPNTFVPCSLCGGSGAKLDIPMCNTCQGTGKQMVETVQVKKQPGDPAFLTVAKAAFIEVAKIEGAYPITAKMTNTLIKETIGVGGEIHRQTQELSVEAPQELPADLIIRGMALLDEIRQREKEKKNKQTIEVEATVVKQPKRKVIIESREDEDDPDRPE